MGHHIKILETLALILKDPDIEAIGNMMRRQRNIDLYDEGIIVSEKQSLEYLDFVQTIIKRAKKYLKI